MSDEFINYSYIEMLIQDLEENSLGYWNATQDEMAKSLRNLQQENQQLKVNCNIGNENLNFYRQENQQLKEENQMLKLTVEKLTKTPYEYSVRGD